MSLLLWGKILQLFSLSFSIFDITWSLRVFETCPNPKRGFIKHLVIHLEKSCFPCWIPENVCYGMMLFFFFFFSCQQYCVDVFWQCSWLMECSVEVMELRVTSWQIEHAVSNWLFFYLGHCGVCSDKVCLNYKHNDNDKVCSSVCVPGPFHRRTQLWMRMMSTGVSRNWQSKYLFHHKHSQNLFILFFNLLHKM